MVGGGEGAFIGAVHRAAAGLDQAMTLVCGAFASDAERSRRSGASLGLPPERCYADFNSMFAAEAKLPADERMEFVAIVTPNDLHLAVATAAFKHGFHVLSDKPATTTLAECFELRDALNASGCLYGLTHPYASYPLVVEAAERVRAGAARHRAQGARRVHAGLARGADRAPRPEAGDLAPRSEARGL